MRQFPHVLAACTPITPAGVDALRRGDAPAPAPALLDALARHFMVPVAYFTDDVIYDEVQSELELLIAMRDTGLIGFYPCRRGDPDPDRPFDAADRRRWAALLRELDRLGEESPAS